VEVVYGSDSGLSARHSQSWDWRTRGVRGQGTPPENSESYGGSLLAANFGRNTTMGYDDLAAADSLNESGSERSGAISVLYGADRGLTAHDDQVWSVQALRQSDPRFFAVTLPDGSIN
jgi:hypothetical protein